MTWQFIDHGADGAQYFPGVGTAGSIFNHVVIGVGDTYVDALDDALEQMREEGVPEEVLEEIEKMHRPTRNSPPWMMEDVHSMCGAETSDDRESCELGYYVAVRWT